MDSAHRQLGIFIASFLVACASGQAKCPLIYIDLDGEVKGAVSEVDQVVVEVSPDPNSVVDPIKIEDGYFKAQIAFDTTRSGGRFHHNCSRRPAIVTVRLLNGEEELDRARLSIEDDFIEDEKGDYRLSSPVELHKERETESCAADWRLHELERRLHVICLPSTTALRSSTSLGVRWRSWKKKWPTPRAAELRPRVAGSFI